MAPIVVYAAYGAYMLVSTTLEILGYSLIKSSVKVDSIRCNRYLIAKQLQGQLTSLDSFVHICYISSVISCHTNVLEETIEQMAEKSITLSGFSIFLVTVACLSIFISNIRRVYFLWQHRTIKPEIYKLMPLTFRNTQISWINNLYAIAITLESTSLSEYIIENGGPIQPGKEKYLDLSKKVKVYPIQEVLMKDKYYCQDIPMFFVLTAHLLLTLSIDGVFDLICVCYIGITLLSITTAKLSLGWKRDTSGVDSGLITEFIRAKLSEFEEKALQVEA